MTIVALILVPIVLIYRDGANLSDVRSLPTLLLAFALARAALSWGSEIFANYIAASTKSRKRLRDQD